MLVLCILSKYFVLAPLLH
uniref:Uncharacterized protein n=1 Tax=Rhizophora mucronata TaxID=61149 RepID=A0A2P2P8Q2_RHIMU